MTLGIRHIDRLVSLAQDREEKRAVPEPSTWAMMLLGFAGLGLCGLSASAESECVDRGSL